jgi:thiol-disulfide isomerase/thioredoxin
MIRKYIVLALLIIPFTLFSQKKNKGYDFTIQIKSIDDSVLYLFNYWGKIDKYQVQDTARNSGKGTFNFKGNKKLSPGVYFVVGQNMTKYFDFIFNRENFKIATDTPDLTGKMKVFDSKENELYLEHEIFMNGQYKKKVKLQNEVEKARATGDKEKVKELKKQQNDLFDETQAWRRNIYENNPELFFSALLKMMDKPNARKRGDDETDSSYMNYIYNFFQQNYLDYIDFSNNGILRTPVYDNKIDEYIDELTIKNPDSIKFAVSRVITKSMANKEVYKYTLTKLFLKYANSPYVGMDEVMVYITDQFIYTGKAEGVFDSTTLEKIYIEVENARYNCIECPAKPLIMQDSAGHYKIMHEIKAEYTVVLFWDIECSHCRKIMPEVRKYYESKSRDSLEVFAVYIGSNKKGWKDYIKKNGLKWINVWDPENNNNFRQYYNVYSTPIIYLLDKEKNIVIKKIEPNMLEQFIQSNEKKREYFRKLEKGK